MPPSFQRWVLPIAVSAIAAGCSGSGIGGSTSAPLPQPSVSVPTSQTPKYFGSVPSANPDFFICIPGVTLKSNVCVAPSKNPAAWIEVLSLSFGDFESPQISGGIVTGGPSSLSSLNILKFPDSTTPLAQLLLYSGTPVTGDARLIETRTDPTGTFPFSEIDLKSPLIQSDQFSGSGGFGVVESMSLGFAPGAGAMQYAYQPLVNGLAGPVYKKNWDVATHASDYTPNTVLPASGTPGIVPALRSMKRDIASSSKPRVSVPDALVQALANKGHMPVAAITSILNGNYTELLTIPGLKGTSTVPGYTNATEMLSFSVGASNAGGGPSASSVNFQKFSDFNAPALWELIASSMPFSGPQVEFDLVDTTVSPSQKVAYFQFGTPYPQDYSAAGSAGGGPTTEALGIYYAQINFCVVPYTNGVAGKPVCQSWNYITNGPT